MVIPNIIEVGEAIDEDGVTVIDFRNRRQILPSDFFEALAPIFKSKLAEIGRTRGPFDIEVVCVWAYRREYSFIPQDLIGVNDVNRHSIHNEECIDNCYQIIKRKITDNLGITDNTLEKIILAMGILNDNQIW